MPSNRYTDARSILKKKAIMKNKKQKKVPHLDMSQFVLVEPKKQKKINYKEMDHSKIDDDKILELKKLSAYQLAENFILIFKDYITKNNVIIPSQKKMEIYKRWIMFMDNYDGKDNTPLQSYNCINIAKEISRVRKQGSPMKDDKYGVKNAGSEFLARLAASHFVDVVIEKKKFSITREDLIIEIFKDLPSKPTKAPDAALAIALA